MPHNKTTEIDFFKDLHPFMCDIVTDAFMIFLKFNAMNHANHTNHRTITEEYIIENVTQNMKFFLNNYWHCYGKNNNEHIVVSFDRLLSHNIIKSPACLISWMDVIGETIIKQLDFLTAIPILINKSDRTKRFLIKHNVNLIYNVVKTQINDIGCDSFCRYEIYDGEDIFEICININY